MRQRDLPSTDSLPRWLQWPVWGQAEPESQSHAMYSTWISHVGGKDPRAWVIFHCLPRPLTESVSRSGWLEVTCMQCGIPVSPKEASPAMPQCHPNSWYFDDIMVICWLTQLTEVAISNPWPHYWFWNQQDIFFLFLHSVVLSTLRSPSMFWLQDEC